MNKIKNFVQFVREFVDNSLTELEDLKKAKYNIETLIETINDEFVIEEDDSEEEILNTYKELSNIKIFMDLNRELNKFFERDTNLYSNLQQTSHLLKDMIEQYDMKSVYYSHKKIDSSIDKFIDNLNNILPFVINKIVTNDFEMKER